MYHLRCLWLDTREERYKFVPAEPNMKLGMKKLLLLTSHHGLPKERTSRFVGRTPPSTPSIRPLTAEAMAIRDGKL